MSGVLLAFISAVFWALLDVSRKVLVREISPVLAAGLVSAGSGILFLPSLLLLPGRGLSFELIPSLLFLLSVSINIAAVLLFFSALKVSPLSLTVPYLNFTPVFMTFTGMLFLGEIPSLNSFLGIALVVVGAFVLNYSGSGNPLASLLREKGSLMMLGVAGLWSLTGPLEKVVLRSFDPLFMSVVSSLLIGSAILLFNLKEIRSGETLFSRRVLKVLLFTFFVQFLAILTQFLAVQKVFVAYVDTIKRSGTIISVLFGYFYFGERPLSPRLIGSLIMIGGVAILSFSIAN